MERQGILYFVHINYEYCDILNTCHLEKLGKAVGLDLQTVTVIISAKVDTGLVYVIHSFAAE